MKHLLSISLCLLFAIGMFAEEVTVSGTVLDAQTSEPLIGVSVVVKGTTNGIVTDFDGNFTLKVETNSVLALSYVGYDDKEITVSKAGNLGVINMTAGAIGLEDVMITGQLAVTNKTPVAVSQITGLEIEERLGGQEFVEVLKTTPGVHANKQGGGWGDSEITMRGFSSENVGVMVNGCPMNDMEWGGVYWSNWQGLSDVTSVMQTQRGMGASKVSVPTVGGSINIVTKGIDAKKGGTISYSLGNDGYNKIAFSVSTGLMENGWAVTLLGSRTWGDGYVQGTPFLGHSYFANISKRINDAHQLSLTAFGAPQWHYQRSSSDALTLDEWDKAKQWMKGGMHWTRYNPTYGFDQNGQMKTSNYNKYHKPQISLNHVWQIDHKSSLSTTLYTSIGRGFGYRTFGGAFSSYGRSSLYGSSGGVINMLFRKDDGTFAYDEVYELNTKSEHGSELVMTENRNFHNWYGLVSTYTTRFADMFDFYAGVDFRYYKGTHTATICDLYGGDYFLDSNRKNVLAVNNPKRNDDSWVYEKLGVGDVVYRDYDGCVMQEGFFAQLEYNTDRWSAFVNGAFNANNNWRIDRFYYDEDHKKSDVKTFIGGNIKAGVNFNMNEYNNVFVNAGYISRVPKFSDGIFLSDNFSHAINSEAKNEQIASVELGYGFHNQYVKFDLNGYFTEWMDKTMTKTGELGPEKVPYYMNMTGVNARHMGIEAELQVRPAKWLDLNVMFSLGDWKWDSDSVKGTAYDDIGNPLNSRGEVVPAGSPDQAYAYINMKGIHVGGSAQTTASFEAIFKPFTGARVGLGYVLYARNYAAYSFNGGNLSLGKTMNIVEPWKVPTGGQLDFQASYRFQIGKLDATLAGNIHNLLNQYYIEKAYNPQTASDKADVKVEESQVRMFFSQGRTFNLRLKIQF